MGCSGGSREELCQFDTIPPMRYAAGYIGRITKKQGAPLRTHPEKSTYDRNSSVITTLEFLVGAGGLRKPRIEKGPAGAFLPPGRKAPGRSCSHPPAYVSLTFAQKKTASVSLHQRFFHGAKQPKSEPLPSGASLAAISSKVMVFVPSL